MLLSSMITSTCAVPGTAPAIRKKGFSSPRLPLILKAISPHPIKFAPQRGSLIPTSVVESLMQINGTSPFFAIHFRSGGQQAKTVEPEILDFTPDCVGTYAPRSPNRVNTGPIRGS